MFRMLNITAISKSEADALCDELGLQRREVRHATRGWSYTSLRNGNEACGEITPQATGRPLTLAIDLDRINKSQRLSLLK